jgi:TatD DNase family protein
VKSEPSALLPLVDTHCHLDDTAFSGDLADVLQESRDTGVVAWIIVGFAPERWDAAMSMAGDIPGMGHMLGLHPGHAEEWNDETRKSLVKALVGSRARAVGEIGLDFYRDNAAFDVQRRALIDQMQIARELDLPVVFHLRDAEEQMLEILERENVLPRMVFHSYDGSERLTRFINEHSAIVGVGGLATRQKSVTLREQLRKIPLTSMVLETDAPYLVPSRQKVRRNTPAHLRIVADFLADHLGVGIKDIARHTTSTAESVFGPLQP